MYWGVHFGLDVLGGIILGEMLFEIYVFLDKKNLFNTYLNGNWKNVIFLLISCIPLFYFLFIPDVINIMTFACSFTLGLIIYRNRTNCLKNIKPWIPCVITIIGFFLIDILFKFFFQSGQVVQIIISNFIQYSMMGLWLSTGVFYIVEFICKCKQKANSSL